MKIVVSATAPAPDAAVDPRFGRAACFVLFDTETNAFTMIANAQNLAAAQGAGIQAGQAIAQAGAEVLITGHCGPKAFLVLKQAGVRIFTGASGSVKEAVAAFQAGSLAEAKAADVSGHWI